MNDVDELLDIARENINTTQMKQEYEILVKNLMSDKDKAEQNQIDETQEVSAQNADVIPMPQKKRQRDFLTIDESMSEFEWARITSKTWDMEQG